MKKKRAIRNFVLLSIFIVLTLLLTFVPFPVLGTNYNFLGLGNLHMGLELGGGVKNTYNLEVADWYEGSKEQAYNKAIERVQYAKTDKTRIRKSNSKLTRARELDEDVYTECAAFVITAYNTMADTYSDFQEEILKNLGDRLF